MNAQQNISTKQFIQNLGLTFDSSMSRIRFESKNDCFLIDGYKFPSESESRRYVELKLKALRGEIEGLLIGAQVGVSYRLENGESYKPTFVYTNKRGETVLEDARKIQSADNLRKIEMMQIERDIKVKLIKMS